MGRAFAPCAQGLRTALGIGIEELIRPNLGPWLCCKRQQASPQRLRLVKFSDVCGCKGLLRFWVVYYRMPVPEQLLCLHISWSF